MELKPKPFKFIPQIPCWWFSKAVLLPGKALGVGELIWLSHKVTLGKKPPIPFSRRYYNWAKISRQATNRAITQLEKAGLIKVARGKGKAPRITIVTESEYRRKHASFTLDEIYQEPEDSQVN